MAGRLCFVLPSLIILGCSTKPDQPSIQNQVTDTRQLVQEAYNRIDHIQMTVAFSAERCSLLQSRIVNESDIGQRLNLSMQYATELLKLGNTAEAIHVFEQTWYYIIQNDVLIDPDSKRMLQSMIAVSHLRHGEIENCLQHHNHESCFIPIQGKGVHLLPNGSRQAIKWYTQLLEEFPNDLESRYLLNLAYMTLGEYPHKVPVAFRIPTEWFQSKINFPRFRDVAPELGLNHFGLSGGAVVDDFTNDGWLDIVITSWGVTEELVFFVNNGDGTFTDQTESFGLKGHVGSLNLNHTDFNNDGWLDLYLMRGGWLADAKGDIPNTLLLNTGKGNFIDVTISAGLTHHAPTQTSAWADFNLDGWLDLVVGNESAAGYDNGIDLYINKQDGTFEHASSSYGLTSNGFYKGVIATDVNNDRYPDLYISTLTSENLLFINQERNGKRSFVPVDPQRNPGQPVNSFPCWSFDYNNDGFEDLFVSGYAYGLSAAPLWMQGHMGNPDKNMLPKLYRNNGQMVFEEVGIQSGLHEVAFTMGCNFGDINTDGYLDFYLATGNPQYQSLVPNKMYLNIEGQYFEDVSYAGGFAHIQKGHGVAFGDLDHDGDEDMYVTMGGAYEGDGFFNCLFENPNADRNNWVVLSLKGITANAAAIGARVMITVQEGDKERMIHRTVTTGSSFGGNSLALEVGLRKATSVHSVSVQWPCKDCPVQVFTGLDINKAYRLIQDEITPQILSYIHVPFSGGKGNTHQHSH